MKLPSKIFTVGAPGSRWSGVAQTLEQALDLNTSDQTANRSYSHHSFSGHLGAYFGTHWEFSTSLDQANLDRPFATTNGTRMLKSHEWAYCLDEIYDRYPQDWILLVYRPDLECQAWWHEAGGFTIAYPDYRPYYKDSMNMLNEIVRMNRAIMAFSQQHNLAWHHWSSSWIKHNFGCDAEPQYTSPDMLVCLLKR